MTDTNEKKCAGCGCGVPAKEGRIECHGAPPAVLPVMVQNQITGQVQTAMQSVFPIVDGAWWCECWKPQTAAKIVTLNGSEAGKKPGEKTGGNPNG